MKNHCCSDILALPLFSVRGQDWDFLAPKDPDPEPPTAPGKPDPDLS